MSGRGTDGKCTTRRSTGTSRAVCLRRNVQPGGGEADRAWQRAEAKVAQGYLGDPGRGRQTFRAYVENTWLPNHQVEASTLQGYTYLLNKHIMDEFGPMRMIDILPEHVREWITGPENGGVKPPTIRYCFIVLSAIFTTALNDQVTFAAPVQGSEDPAGPGPAAHHHHPGAVRRGVRLPA